MTSGDGGPHGLLFDHFCLEIHATCNNMFSAESESSERLKRSQSTSSVDVRSFLSSLKKM